MYKNLRGLLLEIIIGTEIIAGMLLLVVNRRVQWSFKDGAKKCLAHEVTLKSIFLQFTVANND